MSRKPVIGINSEFRPGDGQNPALTWLDAGYHDCVSAAGGLPLVIPPTNSEEDLKAYLEQVDGLVLIGCALDLDPIRLGMEKHPRTRVMPLRREDFDRRLCKLAVEMKVPTLAIGAGMQLMNVLCGGTLFQHIPEDIPKALQHRDTVETHNRHLIDVVPGTTLYDIYGPGEIRVNSHHHMAVDQVAPVFRVAATCPDGVIEAFESIEEDWFCLGVQWHPENYCASALDMQVFEAFVQAARTAPAQTIPMRGQGRRKAAA